MIEVLTVQNRYYMYNVAVILHSCIMSIEFSLHKYTNIHMYVDDIGKSYFHEYMYVEGTCVLVLYCGKLDGDLGIRVILQV